MRLFPIVSAIVVAAIIFAVVIERDRLRAMLAGPPQADLTSEQVDADTDSDTALTPAAPEPEDGTIAVVAVDSIAREVDNRVILRGRTEADRQVTVMSQTSGLIISEPLHKGRFVEANEIICEVEPGTRPAALAEARARLAEAEINKTAADRLSQGGFASETQLSSAVAAWEAASAGVEVAETEMQRLHIEAPFSGVLETDSAELGTLMQPGSACATLIRLDPIRVVGFLPEIAVEAVETGAMAGARLSNGREVVGRVVFVARSADETTRTFRVDIEVANPDLTIRDGQSAEMAIEVRGSKAHLLPQSALTLNDSGTMGVRIVAEDNTAQFVPVTLLRDTTEGVLLGGLPDQAQVIIVGQEYVSDGVKVTAYAPGERS